MPIVYADPLKGRPREASRIPAPTSEVLMEQFAQTFEENPVMAAKRWYELNEQRRTGTPLDAPTARQRIKDAGMEGDLTVDDAGITNEALNTLIWRKGIEKRRQDVFARAQGGTAETAGRFGVAIATSLADPIGAGLNFVPVVGQARYARWLNSSRGIVGRLGVRAAVGAAEGAAGAAIVEPLIYGSRTAEQADYDMTDSLLNVAFGGIFGTAMHTTVGTLGEVLARRVDVPRSTPAATSRTAPDIVDLPSDVARAMRPDDFQAAVRAAVGQAVSGDSPIDVDGVVAARMPTVESRSASGASTYAEAIPEINNLPPVAPDSVRFYHGGQPGFDGGTRFVTEDPRYALGYATKEGRTDATLQYVDVPKSYLEQAGINKSYVDDGLSQRAPYVHWDVPPEIARQLQDVSTDPAVALQKRMNERANRTQAAASSPSVAGRTAPDVERAELDRYAEQTIARETSTDEPTADALAMAKEEASLAEADLKALTDRLGIEIKDANYEAVNEAVVNAERWAKTAELATVCLTRGG